MMVNHAVHHLQLILTETDQENGQPLRGALCRLAHAGQPDQPPLTKKSAAGGSIKVKSLAGGSYQLTVVLHGYLEAHREITVVKGKLLRVGVGLENVAS
jgi:hypothetical protein